MDKELTQTPEQRREWIKKSIEQLAHSLKDDPEMLRHAMNQFSIALNAPGPEPMIQNEPRDSGDAPAKDLRPDDNNDMSKFQEINIQPLAASKEIELTSGQEVTIGRREAESDEKHWLTINQRSVSRTHAKLGKDDQGFYIKDLGNSGEGSTLGTEVGGVRIAAGEKVRLENSQKIKIGQVVVDLSFEPNSSKIKLSWGSKETLTQT